MRDRESDIGAVGSGRDQQPTAGSPGSLTTATTTQSANLQADYRVAARALYLERGLPHLPDRDSGQEGDLVIFTFVGSNGRSYGHGRG